MNLTVIIIVSITVSVVLALVSFRYIPLLKYDNGKREGKEINPDYRKLNKSGSKSKNLIK